ncbi:MAG: ATP-binding protein, partial [Acutalibacteraceae bacterium]|nr:ATP-binding protein [Acutalibacteraceae bacterium]
VIYRPVKEIIDEIRKEWSKSESLLGSDVDRYKSCQLLIVDEIGVQYGSESERIELYSIFNTRYEDCLPTIVISNNSLNELQRILGQRIYDRLTGDSLIFELKGKSYRQENVG